MPILALVLIAYYTLSTLFFIARGPYTAHLTPISQAVRTAAYVAVSAAWLSLPVVGGLPWFVFAIVAFGGLLIILVIGQTGKSVNVDASAIAWSTFFSVVYVIILLTLNYS